jgi:hypothetical protein
MRPGSENTPSRFGLSTKRLDAKLDVASERLNLIVQAEKFEIFVSTGCGMYDMIFADFSEPMLDKLRNKIGSDERVVVINVDFVTSAWTQHVELER